METLRLEPLSIELELKLSLLQSQFTFETRYISGGCIKVKWTWLQCG